MYIFLIDYGVLCVHLLLTGNLLAMSFGGVCAWASVNFLLLQEDNSPVHTGKLMLNEAAAVVSSLTFGGICGNILFGALSERYGRKIPLMCAAIPQFVYNLCLLCFKIYFHLHKIRKNRKNNFYMPKILKDNTCIYIIECHTSRILKNIG